MLIYKKLQVIMRPIILKDSNNLFVQLFLKLPTYVLCKINFLECAYWSVN
jgi:hypothetical protein